MPPSGKYYASDLCLSLSLSFFLSLSFSLVSVRKNNKNTRRVNSNLGSLVLKVLWKISLKTDIRRLTTGIRPEKSVVRRFRRCANFIEFAYTNLDIIAYCKPRPHGIAYCSQATNLYSTLLYYTYIILYYIILYYIILYYIILYYIILYYIILYYIILYYIILYYIILYYIKNRYDILCYIVLCYVVLRFVMLCYVVLC